MVAADMAAVVDQEDGRHQQRNPSLCSAVLLPPIVAVGKPVHRSYCQDNQRRGGSLLELEENFSALLWADRMLIGFGNGMDSQVVTAVLLQEE